MPEADFTAATEVYFGNLQVDEVYMGIVKLWPLAAGPVNGTIDLNVPAYSANIQALENYQSFKPIQTTLPHTVDHVYVDVLSGTNPGVDFRNLIISSSSDSVTYYGHNKSQDPNSQGDSYPGGASMQSRYGGDWVLPAGGKAGDVIYVNIGGYGGFYTMAVVTLT